MRCFRSQVILAAALVGCGSFSTPSTQVQKPVHWLEQGIDHEGTRIDLGYRGERTSAEIEPVAVITRQGKPVSDAMVFVQLVSADGKETFGDEAATVYEPGVGKAPALYAPGPLKVSEGDASRVVRFRVVLPEVDVDWTRDVKLP